MINAAAFHKKRKQLRVSIARNKRQLKTAIGLEAERLLQSIVDDEEQLALFTLMMRDVTCRVQMLYDTVPYGPPQ